MALKAYQTVQQIIVQAPERGFWLGPMNSSVAAVISKIPIALPKDGIYLLHYAGTELEISSVDTSLNAYRITDANAVESIESSTGSTVLYLSRPFSIDRQHGTIEKIKIYHQKRTLPSKAVSFESLSAPVDLLDEYVDFSNRIKDKSLTPELLQQKAALIQRLGSEFERRKELAQSVRRSTPPSNGESRCSTGYSGG